MDKTTKINLYDFKSHIFGGSFDTVVDKRMRGSGASCLGRIVQGTSCPDTGLVDSTIHLSDVQMKFLGKNFEEFHITEALLACTQAVGWSKKLEFIMRSPSWIHAARSGSG